MRYTRIWYTEGLWLCHTPYGHNLQVLAALLKIILDFVLQLYSFGENLKNGLERFLNDTDVTRETPVLHILLLPLVVCLVVCLSSLNPELFSLEISFSLYMPLMHRTFISVQSLTPKLKPTPLPALASRLVTLTMPTH